MDKLCLTKNVFFCCFLDKISPLLFNLFVLFHSRACIFVAEVVSTHPVSRHVFIVYRHILASHAAALSTKHSSWKHTYIILTPINPTFISDPSILMGPSFYIVKLGFTEVYIIFLISAQKHRLWVLVRTASPRRFQRVPTIYFCTEIWKISEFLSEKLAVFGGEIFNIFE